MNVSSVCMRLFALALGVVSVTALAGPPVDLPPPVDRSAKQLEFKGGQPVVPVRLMEGNAEVAFGSKGRLRLTLHGGEAPKLLQAPAGTTFRVRASAGKAAAVVARIQLMEVPFKDKDGLAAALADWAGKGVSLKPVTLGGVFGIAGKVVDNRRYALVVDQPAQPPEKLAAQQAQLLTQHGVRSTLLEEVRSPPSVTMEVLDEAGKPLGSAVDRLSVEPADTSPIDVRRVEFGVGYDFHNFEDRSYRGALLLTADAKGKLAVLNQVPLEALLKGLVPSEIFAKAHPEALKAQAVTARGEVLAKVGLKHLADPYLLCTEQHCAVYKGLSGEAASTNAAVDATVGEALFDDDGKLVDSVYSAVCGGHTEHNEIVWGGVPNPALRGKPDLLPGHRSGPQPTDLHGFLTADAGHACKLSSLTQQSKYHWEKRFSSEELDKKVASLGVGKVFAMQATERGVSGRVRLLTISGSEQATTVRGELTIRRLFGNLNSALFELRLEKDAKGRPATWIFTGAGWGHGVGLCQTGAIGRAEAGQSYREILGHYFTGASVARLY